MNFKLTRRQLLKGAAATGAAAALLGPDGLPIGKAQAQTAEKSAVLIVFLRGGYNALFSSADSFAGAGTFGVSAGNMKNLGNGLFIDNATFGVNLPLSAQANMAAIGINHGLSSHDPARIADWTNGSRSYALMLANALGGTAAIKCAVLGTAFPDGPRPAEGSVSMQAITDMSTTINALGGGNTDPTIPARATAAAGITAARNMSAGDLGTHAVSLKSVKEAYDSAIPLLSGGTQTFNYGTIAQAYGVAATTTGVTNFTTQMLAAELMVLAGANVMCAVSNAGWDTHGDTNGSLVRSRMNASILPGLKVFVQRTMAMTGRNVTVAILGDFARSLPGSDHARAISATVIGKKVRVGTTGRMSSAVGLPTGSPGVPAFWSFLASVAKAPVNPFGTNPHSALVLP